ncbi:hypothetical protein BF17_13430 [Yersinia similis]|uniref:Glycosyl transferase n=2 Tax=Yersinia pseudotuberculosis complex TaxID=1649845 RepID=G4WJD1_YERPU|nr:alpha-1,2-fucosyltransferase [Yersinia similis]AEP25493.1 glycosyl transferase [Yersinia pseudotuberculosis]AHK20212.1 hypothetical protein BF17_13430 [Yersinia similis]CFQ54065.1 putative glycosyl transferase [Yersinia similis]
MTNKKIVCRLMGGLGNQLFEYAAAYSKAKSMGAELIIDKRFYEKFNYTLHGGYRLDRLKIPNRELTKEEEKIFPEWKIRLMNRFPFLSSRSNKWHHECNGHNRVCGKNVLMLGHWAKEEYFSECHSELKEIFVPKEIETDALIFCDKIKNTNSVSIHIRRGDYIDNKEALKVHGVCSVHYYQEAIGIILDKVENPEFFIFSNDIDWCKKNIINLFPSNINVSISIGFNQEIDLWLMSNAKNHVIANSTFSWWGAWLAKNKDQIVISPWPWYESESKDYPVVANWITINK